MSEYVQVVLYQISHMKMMADVDSCDNWAHTSGKSEEQMMI